MMNVSDTLVKLLIMLKYLLYEHSTNKLSLCFLDVYFDIKGEVCSDGGEGLAVIKHTCCFSVESPAQSVSSGVRTQSPTPSAVSLGSEKSSNVSQDRKVPVPIGTERSARIRQTGTSTPSVIGSNLAAPVGHSGIWSFEGIGGNQGM